MRELPYRRERMDRGERHDSRYEREWLREGGGRSEREIICDRREPRELVLAQRGSIRGRAKREESREQAERIKGRKRRGTMDYVIQTREENH